MKKMFRLLITLILLWATPVMAESYYLNGVFHLASLEQNLDAGGYNITNIGALNFNALYLDQNVETLSAGKTLTTSDMVIQKLDPNGSDRDITLPAEASSTDLIFVIINTANGAGEDLVIKDDTPATIVTLGPGMGMIFTCDGTDWVAAGNDGLLYDAQANTISSTSTITANGFSGPLTGNATTATSIAGITETNGGMLYGTADNAYAWLGAGAEGALLMGNGAGAPSWLAAGATTEILVGGGAADPVWTTATGTGAPVRAGSPALTGSPTVETSIDPDTADGAAIGSATKEWSDLYLAASGVIYGENDQSNTLTSSATGWVANLGFSAASLTTTATSAPAVNFYDDDCDDDDINAKIYSNATTTGTGAEVVDLYFQAQGAVTAGALGTFMWWDGSAQSLILPLNNDATTPTLAFGDGDTGIYETGDNNIGFSINGVRAAYFASNKGLYGITDSYGLLYKAATATNSSIVPGNADTDTGIGRAADDQLSLIAGGVEGQRIIEANSIIYHLFGVTPQDSVTDATTNGTTTVTKAGENFSTTCQVGDAVLMWGGTTTADYGLRYITAVTDNENLVVNLAYTGSVSDMDFYVLRGGTITTGGIVHARGNIIAGQETITCVADICTEDITKQTHFIVSDGGADTNADALTLDDGRVIGQEATFIFKAETDVGDTIVIDTAQQVGWSDFTMAEVGDSVTFIWDGTNWTIKSAYQAGTY